MTAHEQRAATEAQRRVARFRHGLRGLWDRLVGRHGRVKRENEAAEAMRRDAAEREALIQSQLQERRSLKIEMSAVRRSFEAEVAEVHRELAEFDVPAEKVQSQERDGPMTGPRRRNRRSPDP